MARPSYTLVPWTKTGTTSGIVNLTGNQLIGFVLPSTIASTAITFNMALAMDKVSTLAPVADSTGNTISFTVTATTFKYYGFSQDQIAKFNGVEILQMVAGSSETLNQSIYLVTIPRPSI